MKIAAYVFRHLPEVTAEDARELDIINLAFGVIRDGLLYYPDDCLDQLNRLRTANPDIKIILSIGGWGAGGFSIMSRTQDGINRFADSCMTVVDRLALDGLDFDWEYPTNSSAGIDSDPSDKQNFTALLRTVRQYLDSRYPGEHKMLTIAAGCGQYYIDSVEIPKIVSYLDYISLMTYDLSGPWTPVLHHTALYPCECQESSAKSHVEMFMKVGVPAEKLMIGAAFYSRIWRDVPSGEKHGLGETAGDRESGSFGPSFTELVSMRDTDGYTVYRDPVAHAPYIYNEERREFISYDDEISVAEKVDFAKKAGLFGVMYWEHSSDKTRVLLGSMFAEKNKH